jgi:hypothetical protein
LDHFPELKRAGLGYENVNAKVGDCLIINKENQTPEKLKRFRKSNLLEVGKTTLQPGNYFDV